MKKLTLLLILSLLAACNPKKNSVKANTTSATISGVTLGQCAGVNASQVGTIYDSSFTGQFAIQVKSLLSATIDPANVGTISSSESDTTGVRFSGKVKIDTNGNVVGAQSNVLVSVYDSIWLNAKIANPNEEEIRLNFAPATNDGSSITGQFNVSTGEGYLNLSDKFGDIRFQGRIDAQRLSGTVSFANKANVSGGSGLSGNLGQFYIQRCAFLQ
jgi:hypothetical protein